MFPITSRTARGAGEGMLRPLRSSLRGCDAMRRPSGVRCIRGGRASSDGALAQAARALRAAPALVPPGHAYVWARWIVDEARRRHRLPRHDALHADATDDVRGMTARVIGGEPLTYVLGTQPFGPLELVMRPPVLIPRPETESCFMRVVDMLVAHPQRNLRVLDVGTGSGCIALLLAHALHGAGKHAKVVGVDVDAQARALARENVARVKAAACGSPVDVDIIEADIFDDAVVARLAATYGPFDIVVSNPPYIDAQEWHSLDESVRLWESRRALVGDGDGDGLQYYRRLRDTLPALLGTRSATQGSALPRAVVEIGASQARAVQRILGPRTDVWRDDSGHERAVVVWDA